MGFRQLRLASPCGLTACLLSINYLIFVSRAATILHQAVDILGETLPSFSSEVTDPKYIVALDVKQGTSETEELGAGRILAMKDKHGRKFNCSIPDISLTDGEDVTGNTDSMAVAAGSARHKTPSEMLSMLNSLCMYRIEDWWTYELCYKKHIRQFHKEHDQVVAEYSLGLYNEEESDLDEVHEDSAADGPSAKYVRQVYKGGGPCDITGKPRETEVHYVCSEAAKDGIIAMRETATCQYRLTFTSSRICSHPAFQAPQAPVHHVLCTLTADSAASAAPAAALAPADGEGAALEGEAGPPGGGAGNPAMEEGEDPSGSMEDLRQAIKDVGEGLGVNTSSLETALLNTNGGVADQVAAGQKAAAAAKSVAKAVAEFARSGEGPAVEADKGKGGSAAVGPPAPPERDPEEEVFYYDDDEDEEGDEDYDVQDFSRSGMHAEL